VRIVESLHCVRFVEDWSRVRSPGRAARRRHKHRQNIVVTQVPLEHGLVLPNGDVHLHPTLARAVRAEIGKLGQRMNADFERIMLGLPPLVR
jgi:hypothetical protein